jgi:hypothetical protein
MARRTWMAGIVNSRWTAARDLLLKLVLVGSLGNIVDEYAVIQDLAAMRHGCSPWAQRSNAFHNSAPELYQADIIGA